MARLQDSVPVSANEFHLGFWSFKEKVDLGFSTPRPKGAHSNRIKQTRGLRVRRRLLCRWGALEGTPLFCPQGPGRLRTRPAREGGSGHDTGTATHFTASHVHTHDWFASWEAPREQITLRVSP